MLGLVWRDAVRALGAEPSTGTADDVEARYAEPHRSYHTTEHIEAVLRDTAWLGDELGLDARARAVVTLAVCAHDVVYAAQPGADERASADWARSHLVTAGVAAADVAEVVRLVLATIEHSAGTDDVAAAVLLDADLAILAAEPAAYARYVTQVRAEYAAVPDDQWQVGRSRVLASLVDRERLYVTEPAYARWEASARRNVAAELVSIRAGRSRSR